MKKIVYLLSFLLIFISSFLGDASLKYQDIFDPNSVTYTIFWDLRVPRIMLAFFVGSILSLSGLIFQTIFKNALITPYTLGIASGTTLFTAISIVFFPGLILAVSGILGSFFTVIVLYFISQKIHKNSMIVSTNSILLVGIALSFFYSSGLMMIFFMSNLQENYSIMRFTLGSLDVVGFFSSIVVCFISVFLFVIIMFYKEKIKLLLLSNDTAFLKGINVNKLNLILLTIISLAVGISISFVGPIGFVGLVIPHIIKMIYKKSADKLIFPVFFYGGVFLVFSDFISRNLGTDSALPIGVITAFLGAPFFIYLVLTKKK